MKPRLRFGANAQRLLPAHTREVFDRSEKGITRLNGSLKIAADNETGASLESMVPFPTTDSWLSPPIFGEFPLRLQPIFQLMTWGLAVI